MNDQPNRLPLIALLTANAISQVGNMMSVVAIPWFVLQTTGSAAQTGLTAFSSTLPIFFAGIIGGLLVDRFGGRRMSIIADIMSMTTTALVPLLYSLDLLTYPLLLALAFTGTILDTPGATGRQTLLPRLAAQGGVKLDAANAAYGAIFRFSILFGPPLAGLLISLIGTQNVLWIDAATYIVSALLIAVFVPRDTPRQQAERAGGTIRAALRDAGAGLLFFRREHLLFALLILFALVDLLANSFVLVVMPVFSERVYGEAVNYGLLLGTFGGGTLLGTILYGVRGQNWSRRALVLLCILGFGLPLWGFVGLPPVALAAALCFFMGLVIGPVGPMVMTLYHERVPAEMMGRVFGARSALQTISIPFGALLTGVLLETFGLQQTIVLIAALFLVVGAGAFLTPIFHTMQRPPVYR